MKKVTLLLVSILLCLCLFAGCNEKNEKIEDRDRYYVEYDILHFNTIEEFTERFRTDEFPIKLIDPNSFSFLGKFVRGGANIVTFDPDISPNSSYAYDCVNGNTIKVSISYLSSNTTKDTKEYMIDHYTKLIEREKKRYPSGSPQMPTFKDYDKSMLSNGNMLKIDNQGIWCIYVFKDNIGYGYRDGELDRIVFRNEDLLYSISWDMEASKQNAAINNASIIFGKNHAVAGLIDTATNKTAYNELIAKTKFIEKDTEFKGERKYTAIKID